MIGTDKMNGINCTMYQKTEMQGKKKNVYTMWVQQSDQITPVRYEMMGYDSLLGSHFDKYYVDYMKFSNATPPDGSYNVPESKIL